ncbi:MAG: transglycosylase domain-containing protein, partial [Chloroflexota bacterium]
MSRRKARKSGSAGPNALVALFLVFVVTGVTIASAGVIAAGGAAMTTIAALDEGLPDVRAFRDLGFSEPTRIMDRKGKQELARFWEVRRDVVEFDEIPPLILDVTTAVEDDTFWDNPGFDLEATVNAFAQQAAGVGDRGGASTITQQLVRARLLPADVLAADNTQEGLYIRKAKELIQAFKLTQAFPGEEGKKDIITAYLNEIFYGQAYGISAAAAVYFRKDLDELSVAEA